MQKKIEKDGLDMKVKDIMHILKKADQEKDIELICITQYRDGWELLEDRKIYHPVGIGEFDDMIIIQAIRKEGMK